MIFFQNTNFNINKVSAHLGKLFSKLMDSFSIKCGAIPHWGPNS